MKIDKSRFNFIRASGALFDQTMEKVGMVLEGVKGKKPYTIDWEEVLNIYDEKGSGDLCEFASSYTFGWHAKNGKLDDDISKHAMYLEIIEGIARRRENVK